MLQETNTENSKFLQNNFCERKSINEIFVTMGVHYPSYNALRYEGYLEKKKEKSQSNWLKENKSFIYLPTRSDYEKVEDKSLVNLNCDTTMKPSQNSICLFDSHLCSEVKKDISKENEEKHSCIVLHETQQGKKEANSNLVIKQPFLNKPIHNLSNHRYILGSILGKGSFGIVCEAHDCETHEKVAIKKVLQDPQYKNRELNIMKQLSHPNIISLKDYFYTEGSQSDQCHNIEDENYTPSHEAPKQQRYLNVVMEFVPNTVYRIMKCYFHKYLPLPLILVRLYLYQLCRALGYLHGLYLCHRDIKPHNLLVNPKTHVLKLCDFGSAKRLHKCNFRWSVSFRFSLKFFFSHIAEQSVAYICSRFYRAPELMLGATKYTTAIDLWSVGCVLGEFLIGRPLFPGCNSVDQLVKIIQVLGTPSPHQMKAMNPYYSDFQFPKVNGENLNTFLASRNHGIPTVFSSEALHLLSCFLKYDPNERIKPYEALTHPFFDPLYDPQSRLPDGSELPDLFNFIQAEIPFMTSELKARTILPSISSSLQFQSDQSESHQESSSHK